MRKLLEVIVTSVAESVEAEAGGADRLELVASLDCGGLTPSQKLAAAVVEAVHIPVRVMLRENSSMSLAGPEELQALKSRARDFAALPIGGLVTGFVKHGEIDRKTLEEILSAAPHCPVTFHRAFEHVDDPLAAIEQLKQFPQIDRILTNGGDAPWTVRKARLAEWQRAAAPEIEIVVGGGLSGAVIAELTEENALREFHVGRAARLPPNPGGIVSREPLVLLRRALA